MNSISIVACAAYNNVLDLSENLPDLGQRLDDTNRNFGNCIGSIHNLNIGVTNASNIIGQFDSSLYNLNQIIGLLTFH